MKKNLLSIFAASVVLTLTACGQQTNAPATTPAAAPATPAKVQISADPRTQAEEALAEIKKAGSKIETALKENKTPTFNGKPDDKHVFLGLGDGTAAMDADSAKTSYCLVNKIFMPEVFSGELECEIGKGTAQLDKSLEWKSVKLIFSGSDGWSCESNLPPELIPPNCKFRDYVLAGAPISKDPADQVKRAFEEISPFPVIMEIAMREGKTPTFSANNDPKTHVFLGIGDGKADIDAKSTKTRYCNVEWEIIKRGDVTGVMLTCELGKGTEELDLLLSGKGIGYVRDKTEQWTCLTDVAPEFIPSGCHPIPN